MSSRKRRPERTVNLKDLTSEHNKVVTLLANESDRSVAIVGSAFLDDVLREMISSRLVDDKELQSNLLRDSRPLGTFSARIDIAYALGLIPKSIHGDLHRIREIRNAFAHDRELIDFSSDQSIKDRCANLGAKYQNPYVAKFEPRTQFVMTLAWTMHELQLVRAPRLRAQEEITVHHLPPPAIK